MKTIKSIYLMLILLLSVSCANTKVYHTGEPFAILLEKEGQGGYQWSFNEIPGIEVLDSIQTTQKLDSLLVYYNKIYVLVGTKKGNYNLEFLKDRSFEKTKYYDDLTRRIIKIKIK